MKNLPYLLSFVIFALLAVIFIGVLETRKEDQLKQSEIRGLKLKNLMDKKAFEHALDSIRKDCELKLKNCK